MSDVDDSNIEDNSGDDESVPSPPPKEMTLEDVTGKLEDNSDPTEVIERYQHTEENEQRKKDFINARNHFIATEVRAGKNTFLNPAKKPGAASRFGDGDGSFWDRWLGPAPLEEPASATVVARPLHHEVIVVQEAPDTCHFWKHIFHELL